jgi:hypothetical protein
MQNLRRLFLIALLAVAANAADASRQSPPFTILRPGATPLQLSQYRGKPVVLALIHTSCTHCQEFTTTLKLVARDYSPRGVQFLECAFNDDAVAAMPEFLDRFKPPFPVGYSSHAAVSTYLRRTVIDTRPLYVPYLVFVDRTGMILAELSGEKDFFQNAEGNLRAQLDAMLKPASATAARPSHP